MLTNGKINGKLKKWQEERCFSVFPTCQRPFKICFPFTGYTTSNPAGYTTYQGEIEHNDMTSTSRGRTYNDDDDLYNKLPTERIPNDDDDLDNKLPTKRICNDDDDLDDKLPTERIPNEDDDFDFTEDSLLAGTLSPFIYGALGGATVLAIIGIVYACYKGCIRRCRWQQAQNLAMIALSPQALGRSNQMVQLVNEQWI